MAIANIFEYSCSGKQLIFVHLLSFITLTPAIIMINFTIKLISVSHGLTDNVIFMTVSSLFFVYWFLFLELKTLIILTKEFNITNNYFIKFSGFKYYKKLELSLDLRKCEYFIIKTTTKQTEYTIQINYDNQFLILDLGEEDVFKIYNILKNKFPMNNKGKKWKFFIIGNTW